MALSAPIVFEIRPGAGSSGNGGGFDVTATGIDRSQQDAAFATLSTLSTVHSTTTQINVSELDHNVTGADVGNILQVTGGSATPGPYLILAADAGNNRWTMDRSVGTFLQTVVGGMGGAKASIADLHNIVVAGNTFFHKNSGTDTPGQSVTLAAGTLVLPITGIGYNTVRGDLTTTATYAGTHLANGFLDDTIMPLVDLEGFNIACGTHTHFLGINFTGTRAAAQISVGAASSMFRCKLHNASTSANAVTVTNAASLIDSEMSSVGAAGGWTTTSGNALFLKSCRVTSTNAGGVLCTASVFTSINSVLYRLATGQSGLAISHSNPNLLVANNTFYNIAGAGIIVANVAMTNPNIILINNQVSGCEQFANNDRLLTQVLRLFSLHNRIRDTVTPYIGWQTNSGINDITTADTDANEYEDADNNNFRLKSGAAGIAKGLPAPATIGAFTFHGEGGGGFAGVSRSRAVNHA